MAPKGPYRFTADKRDAYLELIRTGGRRMMSARAVGVAPETVERWARSHPAFAEAVSRAETEANQGVEDALYQAATSGNVTACLAWLYSRDPLHWSDKRNVRAEVSGPGGGPIPSASTVDYVGQRARVEAIAADPDAREHFTRLLAAIDARRADGRNAGEPGPPGNGDGGPEVEIRPPPAPT